MKRIVLMGFMGAGKTTVGKALSRKLSCKFLDTDEEIEKEQKRKISEIFEKDGEAFFRKLETELLLKLQNSTEAFVLSIGGGMPLREENRELLRKIGTVIYLKTSEEEIIKRVSKGKNRPLLSGDGLEKKVRNLMAQREEIYLRTAQEEIVTDGKSPMEIAREIENRIK